MMQKQDYSPNKNLTEQIISKTVTEDVHIMKRSYIFRQSKFLEVFSIVFLHKHKISQIHINKNHKSFKSVKRRVICL